MNFCYIAALAAAAILCCDGRGRSECSGRHERPCCGERPVRPGCGCGEPEIIRHHCGCGRPWNRCW